MSKTIDTSTDKYVDILHNYAIDRIISDLIFEDIDNIITIPYPGLIKEYNFQFYTADKKDQKNINKISDFFDKKYDSKVCVGILAFVIDDCTLQECRKCEDLASHYIAIVKTDKKSNKLYLWDSASKNPIDDENETTRFLKKIANGYELVGVNMVLEVQPAAGGSEDIIESQNIFCHTWCLWFLKLVSCVGIEKTINMCSELGRGINRDTLDEYNLVCLANIKKFAIFLSQQLGELKTGWLKNFRKIYIGKQTVDIFNIPNLIENQCWFSDLVKITK